MAALASTQDLADYLQTPLAQLDTASATIYLRIASGLVRDYLQQAIDYTVGDVVYLDPLNGAFVELDEFPVVNVSKVETFDGTSWTVADPSVYTVSRRLGMIAAKPGTGYQWPTDPESWRVTYDHGFTAVPDSINAVVLGAAARGYASPAGVDMERVGQRQIKYAIPGGLSETEKLALARYRIARAG